MNNTDTIFKNFLRAQLSLSAELLGTSIICTDGIEYNTKEFTTIILRNDSTIFIETSKHAYFSENTKKAFSILEPNDKVIFANIVASNYSKGFLNPVEYIIK